MAGRNLVLCLDGTSNRYKKDNTNVIKLFAMLDRNRVDQRMYYQPGVGTITPIGITGRLRRWFLRTLDLAFALLLRHHVCTAYRFLMDNYQPGDRIYIFGFSRGAYTARVLAGMIHKVGLVPRGNDTLVDFAWDEYKRARATDDDSILIARFKGIFGGGHAAPKIECLGLWDTVSSVRYLWKNPTFDNTQTNRSVLHVRHAIALDERCAYFRQNRWLPVKNQDVIEAWFAGVHCDVGGGYFASESGLSNIALQWMVKEIKALPNPAWIDPQFEQLWLPPQDTTLAVAPNALASPHESLRRVWWLLEFLPKSHMVKGPDGWRKRIKIPLGRYRQIPDGVVLHRSVERRIIARTWPASRLPASHQFVD